MITGRFFKEVELPEQKSDDDGVLFPAVLSPISNSDFTAEAQLCGFKEAIKAHKPWLESLLQKRGVILFRGFPVSSPSQFNDVVEAFGFPEAIYVGTRASRSKVVGRVYTANESSPDKLIPFHHEMANVPHFPSKLFFFCEEEPGEGGETPIVLSHIIYEKMKERHPEFVAELEEHGVTYTKLMSDDNHQSHYAGKGWKSAYMTNDKNVAEERARKLGTKLEWMGNAVKTIIGPITAIGFDKENQRKTWFNNLAVSYNADAKIQDRETFCYSSGYATAKVHDWNTVVELGNGEALPDTAVEYCLRIMEEECVAIPWKKGDVMLVNNLMVLHGRWPLLKPPRNILASLCK